MSELLLVFPLQTLFDGGNILDRSFYVAPHEELVMVDALTLIIMLHIFIFIFLKPLLTKLINLTVLLICLLETLDLKGI